MRSFIITISTNKDSVRSAKQVRDSAKEVGYKGTLEHFEAIVPHQWKSILPTTKANFSLMDEKTGFQFGKPDNIGACFASHYLLWKKCIELNEPILILEHDAIFVDNIPDIDFDLCVNFGRPSHIRPFEIIYAPLQTGLHPLVQLNYYGHHAYAIKPMAAKWFVEDVQTRELIANDMWINKKAYPWLQDYTPHPIIADTDFSTTQAAYKKDDILIKELKKITALDSPHRSYFEKYYPQILSPQSQRHIDV